jgi:hypothetical protein
VSDESVLVATSRLDEAMRRQVAEACDHARVRPVFWGAAGPEGGESVASPALLIAALPSGYRTIPDEVVVLASQTFQALPVLLLCGEALVRHSVSLQGGRVTLLGQPLTREKISARIRTAVAGPAAGGNDSGDPIEEDGIVRVRELRGREWWAGAVARDPDRGRRSPDFGDVMPTLGKLGRHGIAGLVPLDLAAPFAAPALQQALASLASGLPADRALASLESTLSAQAAAVWFSPAAGQWCLYAARPQAEVWIYSPLRLPNSWRIGSNGDSSTWRVLPAESGDVLLVAVGGSSELLPADDLRGGELARAAEGGGPALLDHLEARLAARSDAGSALVVELR